MKKTVTTNINYDCVLYPIVTEKSNMIGETNQYTFAVSSVATKPEIKAAIQKIFNVDVISVTTLIKKGKKRVFRGRLGQQSDLKKAVVRLKDGQRIELTGGA